MRGARPCGAPQSGALQPGENLAPSDALPVGEAVPAALPRDNAARPASPPPNGAPNGAPDQDDAEFPSGLVC